MTNDEETVIYNGVPIPFEIYHRLQLFYALRIEVSTGLRHSRGSVMNQARSVYNIQERTKKAVMKRLAEQLAEHGIEVTA